KLTSRVRVRGEGGRELGRKGSLVKKAKRKNRPGRRVSSRGTRPAARGRGLGRRGVAEAGGVPRAGGVASGALRGNTPGSGDRGGRRRGSCGAQGRTRVRLASPGNAGPGSGHGLAPSESRAFVPLRGLPCLRRDAAPGRPRRPLPGALLPGRRARALEEVANNCEHPPDYWTIHGLWPDKSGECNRSWPFNPDEIKGLLPDMRLYWPDVLHSSPNHSVHFWRHEWEKHGTCAAQLDALNSQRKYFGKTLDLYKELALNSTLQKLGIKPSISYYQISDIKHALVGVYGVVPKVQCLPPKSGEKVQTLGQIELCLTRDLQLQDCPEPGEPAPQRREAGPGGTPILGLEICEDGPVFYPPPKETNH
uniref:Ribonuclease T2 n=1 Tax=Sus scrofa TaxID=9823 RepID=A0A287ALP1_PIG